MSDLNKIRRLIDKLDKKIIIALNERGKLAQRIKKAKTQSSNTNIFRPEREAQILRSLAKSNNGPLSDDNLRSIFREINAANSIGICIRQNRFNEGKGKNTLDNIRKSEGYSNEQINYINKSVILIKNKLPDAKFYVWSNDFTNLNKVNLNFNFDIVDVSNFKNNFDIRAFNLFLLSSCKHFIVTPSTFNWWGAWLSNSKNKIVIRPDDNFFSNFRVNNRDFWPDNWIKLSS